MKEYFITKKLEEADKVRKSVLEEEVILYVPYAGTLIKSDECRYFAIKKSAIEIEKIITVTDMTDENRFYFLEFFEASHLLPEPLQTFVRDENLFCLGLRREKGYVLFLFYTDEGIFYQNGPTLDVISTCSLIALARPDKYTCMFNGFQIKKGAEGFSCEMPPLNDSDFSATFRWTETTGVNALYSLLQHRARYINEDDPES